MRKLLLAVAIATCVALGVPTAASATPAAAPPAPARVAPQGGGFTLVICFPVTVSGKTVWHCFVVQVPPLEAGLGPGDCPQCGLAVNLLFDPGDLKAAPTVIGDLGQGFIQLGQAAVAGTPAEQAKLHSAAVNTFLTAARAMGTAKAVERSVGYVDPASGAFDPEPSPWRQQAGADITAAISGLQSYLRSQDANTLAAATARLDDAYGVLAANSAGPVG